MPRRKARNTHLAVEAGEEGPPDALCLLLVEALEHHGDPDRVARPQHDLLAPMRVEEAVPIEAKGSGDELAECRVGRRLDPAKDGAEVVRQLARSEREPGDDAKAAAAATLDAPEQVRMCAGIGGPHGPVGSDDLGLQ